MYLTTIFSTALFLLFFIFAIKFRKAETICTNNEKADKFIDVAVCLAVAVGFSAFFSLSPLNNDVLSTDSSVFIYIGKKMHQGYVPYKDLFDHKGPVMYFIQYVGTFGKNQLILWLLEIAGIFATAVFLLKSAKLFTGKKAFQYFAVFSSIAVCGMDTFDGGNYTEEWALPWIAAAMFICLKSLKEDKYSLKNMFWLGAGFAFVFLLRVNMAVVWVVFVPIIGVKLLAEKRFADIFRCVFGFITGAVIITAPVLIYEFVTDSFADMIKCYFTFNLTYTASDSTVVNIIAIALVLLMELNILLMAFALVLSLMKKQKGKLYWYNFAFFLASLFFTSISGRAYEHYAIILIPAMTVPLILCAEFIAEKLDKEKKTIKPAAVKAAPLLCLCLAVITSFYAAKAVINSIDYNDRYNSEISDYIRENTNADDDVIILGNYAYYYYECNRSTKNKFFYQTPPLIVSDELYAEFLEECEKKPSDYIFVAQNTAEYETRISNLWDYVRLLEAGTQNGSYTAERFEDFTVYKRVK